MYWNNPTIKLTYPSDQDPIKDSFHNGVHCLFYNPAILKEQIHYKQSLQDICNWANNGIKKDNINGFLVNQQNWYDIANLVKLNMWVDHIKKQGIIKPILTYYDGNKKLGVNNGESRLRALERIPAVRALRGFISTSVKYADNFDHLTQVHSFEQFAQLCEAVDQQEFLFTFTDSDAPYGIYWYEYDSVLTAKVTPGEPYCVDALRCYLKKHPTTEFTTEWFDTLIMWTDYKSSN